MSDETRVSVVRALYQVDTTLDFWGFLGMGLFLNTQAEPVLATISIALSCVVIILGRWRQSKLS